jgi:hypothetical protein
VEIITAVLKEKENDVGGTCSKHGRGVESVLGFDGKVRKKGTIWKTKA